MFSHWYLPNYHWGRNLFWVESIYMYIAFPLPCKQPLPKIYREQFVTKPISNVWLLWQKFEFKLHCFLLNECLITKCGQVVSRKSIKLQYLLHLAKQAYYFYSLFVVIHLWNIVTTFLGLLHTLSIIYEWFIFPSYCC